jgi:hypothetical protein
MKRFTQSNNGWGKKCRGSDRGQGAAPAPPLTVRPGCTGFMAMLQTDCGGEIDAAYGIKPDKAALQRGAKQC